MLYAFNCQSGVSLTAGAGGSSPAPYTAQACSRWLLSDSPSGAIDWATPAGAAAFAFTAAGLLLTGIANWLARPLANGHVDEDPHKRACVVAGLYLGAAASTAVAWAAYVGLAALQFSAGGLAALMRSSPAAQVALPAGAAALGSLATGPGVYVAAAATAALLFSGIATALRWEDRRDNGPPPPLTRAFKARPGQTAAVLTGWLSWLPALASTWTQWYTWNNPVPVGSSEIAAGGYTWDAQWACRTGAAGGPNALANYCVSTGLTALPGEISLTYPFVAGTTAFALVITALVVSAFANHLMEEVRVERPRSWWWAVPAWAWHAFAAACQIAAFATYVALLRGYYVPVYAAGTSAPAFGAGLGLVVVASIGSAATAAVAFLWRSEGGAGLGDILPMFDGDASVADIPKRTPPKAHSSSRQHILPPATTDSTPRTGEQEGDWIPRANAAATYAVGGSPATSETATYAVACSGSPASPLAAGDSATASSEDASQAYGSQAFTVLPGCLSPEAQV